MGIMVIPGALIAFCLVTWFVEWRTSEGRERKRSINSMADWDVKKQRERQRRLPGRRSYKRAQGYGNTHRATGHKNRIIIQQNGGFVK